MVSCKSAKAWRTAKSPCPPFQRGNLNRDSVEEIQAYSHQAGGGEAGSRKDTKKHEGTRSLSAHRQSGFAFGCGSAGFQEVCGAGDGEDGLRVRYAAREAGSRKDTKKHEGTRSRPTHHQNGCAFGCGSAGFRAFRGWWGVAGKGFVLGDVTVWEGFVWVAVAVWRDFVLQRRGGVVHK